MTFFDTIILGIVEGITEFLPVSSTGHLILASALLHLEQTEFLKTFEVVIQLGSILAVVVLYFKKFFDLEIIKRLIVAFIPTGIIGLVLYHFIKAYLLANTWIVVAALIVGGLIIIAIEYTYGKIPQIETDVRTLTYKQALLIGIAQSVAIIPGVSRSGATVMGGLLMKIPRATILEFSFLLAVPTMLAASGLDIVKNPSALLAGNGMLLATGFVVAFLVALLTIRIFMTFTRSHSFVPFGIYRIIAALAFWLLILA